MTSPVKAELNASLEKLHLPAFLANHLQLEAIAGKEAWSYSNYLLALCNLELQQREQQKIARLLQISKLPREKTLPAFDRSRLKSSIDRQFSVLLKGDFLDRKENLLIFGNPGSGKTHLLSALGHELVYQGRSVVFTSSLLLVQRLLLAKSELSLEKELRKLDRFEALIIDDIGYIQQSQTEMEVLFALIAHRYERASILLTSNLVFSHWEKIFKDPMMTAAAIDRLVHHSTILELNLPSFRLHAAQKHNDSLALDSQHESSF